MAARSRILFLQTSFDPPGGGSGVAAWMLQALVRDHDVSVLSWDTLDCTATNRFFGTSLRATDFVAHGLSRTLRFTIDALPSSFDQLRIALLVRRARRLHAAAPYDLFVTASNEVDFGVPGIQYVHYPSGSWPRPSGDLRMVHRLPGAVALYRALCHRLGSRSFARLRENLTLANSSFIAEKIHRTYGTAAIVVSPPVAGSFPEVPWQERADDLVCIGRLSPEKDQLKVIEIVSRVRAMGHDVGLDLVGMHDDVAYGRRVETAATARPWVRLHRDLSRSELVRLLVSKRYGIHGMIEEHFGMSVAELVSAGCIVFVADRGGPTEIVGGEPSLLYGSVDEAVARIDAVLRSPARQLELQRKLLERRGLYTTTRFEESIRTIVTDHLASHGMPS